jgi:long-chain acyl-CoA synthetase
MNVTLPESALAAGVQALRPTTTLETPLEKGARDGDPGFDGDDIHGLRTLPELLAHRVAHSPGLEAYRQFDSVSNQWLSLNWAQAGALVQRWTRALALCNLPHGARVAVLLPNGLHAVCVDQAAIALGHVPVPLHALDNPGSVAYIVADSEASICFAQSQAQWAAIAAVGVALPELRQVVVTAATSITGDSGGVEVVSLDVWLAAASQSPSTSQPQPQPQPQPLLPASHPPSESDLACIVYTSGTTGKPKGVMLTHANVMSNVKSARQHVPSAADDIYLSFLPMSHTFERTLGYYGPIAAGSCVAFARSVALLADDLRQVRPTVLVSVPRIYERVHAQIDALVATSPIKRALLAWAQAVGWRRFCAQQQLPVDPAQRGGWADGLVWPLLERLVARPLRQRFGGRLRVAVCGGAALPPAVARRCLGLGLPLLQGYGLTETSPVVAANTLGHNDPATVGTALPGVELRIGDHSELLVRGPTVMKGYWKRPEDTARVLSADGWLHTGDQASLQQGRLRILGRIKDIIVTSTGEKISPTDLEAAITSEPLFEQAWVVGEGRPFIAVVLVLNKALWPGLAAELGVDENDPASLDLPAVRAAALLRVAQQTTAFARYAVPKAVCLSLVPWTLEDGLMTPTLKLKRNVMMARFAPLIEALYASAPNRSA